jgi:hypothetical protein
MTSSAADGLARCATRIGQAVDSVLASLAGLEARAAACWTAAEERGRRPTTSDLALMRPGLQQLLRDQGSRFLGAGVVAAPDALDDAPLHLEWWQRAGQDTVHRLRLALDPADENFYDYTVMPWFAVPRDAGHGTVSGPYVDLTCANRYVLTFTRPLVTGGRFAGVVGADITLAAFEQLLVPPLKQLGADAVLVTGEGRILATNTPARTVGALAHDLLASSPAADRAAVPATAADWSVIGVRRGAFADDR